MLRPNSMAECEQFAEIAEQNVRQNGDFTSSVVREAINKVTSAIEDKVAVMQVQGATGEQTGPAYTRQSPNKPYRPNPQQYTKQATPQYQPKQGAYNKPYRYAQDTNRSTHTSEQQNTVFPHCKRCKCRHPWGNHVDQPVNQTQSQTYNNTSGRQITCFSCGQTGHINRQCPNKNTGRQSNASGLRCYHCQQMGHIQRDCTNLFHSRGQNM